MSSKLATLQDIILSFTKNLEMISKLDKGEVEEVDVPGADVEINFFKSLKVFREI